jgi:hypothetical protein
MLKTYHQSYMLLHGIIYYFIFDFIPLCMIPCMMCGCSIAAADPAPAQRADANEGENEHDPDLDQRMDSDKERDFILHRFAINYDIIN